MNETNQHEHRLNHFELIYKHPNDEIGWWEHDEQPVCYFLYLSPCEDHQITDSYSGNDDDDMDSANYQTYSFKNRQATIKEKFLFIDVMRFFGGFHSEHQQPELILCERCEIER